MARWSEIAAAAPEFAAEVRQRLDAYRHKTLATLRKDGSPRISGIEAGFGPDDVWIGMMPGSVKAADVLRDPRVALHSGSEEPRDDAPSAWSGDAKLSGRAVEVTDPAEREVFMPSGGPEPEGAYVFRIDITEVVLTRVGDPADHLVIESWHEGQGYQRRTRA